MTSNYSSSILACLRIDCAKKKRHVKGCIAYGWPYPKGLGKKPIVALRELQKVARAARKADEPLGSSYEWDHLSLEEKIERLANVVTKLWTKFYK